MLNRALRVLFLLLIASPALAVGTIPLSMTQQLDQYGVPLSGCQLFIIQAGTTSTPQNAYKDTALTLPQPNPMVCDASGRLPQFFLADGQIKIILRDKLGNPQTVLDNILVIGPSSGAGGGGVIDPTTIASTGDIKQAYGTQIITGWVRFNGRTIGNAVSGATERANADTQALFLYLYAADPNLTVSGGRTTGAADYAANKTITLPDGRGRALAGLDDMGNSAAGRLTSPYFGAAATTLGVAGGSQSHSLLAVELAAHNHGVFLNDPGHVHVEAGGTFFIKSTPNNSIYGPGTNGAFNNSTTSAFTGITVRDTAGGGGTANQTASTGNGTAFSVLPPMILTTIYIKL